MSIAKSLDKYRSEIRKVDNLNMKNLNEFELARIFSAYFKIEHYEKCEEVKQEVDRRIASGTLDHAFMSGFRSFDPKTQTFYGEPSFGDLNGLFDNYKYPTNQN